MTIPAKQMDCVAEEAYVQDTYRLPATQGKSPTNHTGPTNVCITKRVKSYTHALAKRLQAVHQCPPTRIAMIN